MTTDYEDPEAECHRRFPEQRERSKQESVLYELEGSPDFLFSPSYVRRQNHRMVLDEPSGTPPPPSENKKTYDGESC